MWCMATVHIVTKKERKAERRARFKVVCNGMSKDDFRSLLRVLNKDFGCKTVLLNPFPPQFNAKAVHEIIAHVTGSAIGGYAAKKTIDARQRAYRRLLQVQVPESAKERRRSKRQAALRSQRQSFIRAQWQEQEAQEGKVSSGLTADQKKRLNAIHHLVHEYANFVSSAEMVLTGKVNLLNSAFTIWIETYPPNHVPTRWNRLDNAEIGTHDKI